MKLILNLSVFLLFAVSCTNNKNTQFTEAETLAEPQKTVEIQSTDSIKINFGNFNLSLVGLTGQIFNEKVNPERHEIKTDTFFYEMPLGSSLENATIYVGSEGVDLNTYRLSEAHVYALSLQNEGPHLDLNSWKPVKNAYLELEAIGKNQFKSLSVNYENLGEKFGKIDYKALKKYVDSICKKDQDKMDWVQVLGKVDSEAVSRGEIAYPLSLGITQRIIKVEATISGKKITKWLVFNESMGC